MKKTLLLIVCVAFMVSCVVLGVRFKQLGTVDDQMWAHQAEYIQVGDSRVFDPLQAYGHPGGPLIIGTIVTQRLFHVSYYDALLIFLTVSSAFFISLICVMCYVLRKDHWWWVAVLGIVSMHSLYNSATPPSVLASLLIVLLSLATLYLIEQKENVGMRDLFLWGAIAGMATATRADIGGVCTAAFLLVLLFSYSWKKIVTLIVTTFLVFVAANPFMWFMPLRHMHDLVSKVLFHYAEFSPTRMSFVTVTSISFLTFLSIFFLLITFTRSKREIAPLPTRFSITLLVLTLFLYTIFLTARYQAPRYFQPIIFVWEVFLPLFLFHFLAHIRFSFVKTTEAEKRWRLILKTFLTMLLVLNPAVIFIVLLFS